MTQQDHISRKRVVYTVDGMDAVRVRRDIAYGTSADDRRTMDIYYPPNAIDSNRYPAVVFVTGFSDSGARTMLGRTFKEMGSFTSWAELVAVSGLLGITYENVDPIADAQAVFDFIRAHAAELQLDHARIGVWSCSGHAPNALTLLTKTPVRCAALFYPYTLDLEGGTGVANAATQFRFVNASAGQTVADLPSELPMFLARAGQDQMPGLNEAMDRFACQALGRNLPLTLMNHALGPHGFDLYEDSPTTREIVRCAIAFLKFQLSP
jgi:hypothetical protein